MKKLFVLLTALAFTVSAIAQPKAIGLRVNARSGPGVEIAYQHTTGSDTFLTANVGFDFGNRNVSYAGFAASANYNWIFAKAGLFDFYAGPGAFLGIAGGSGNFSVSPGVCAQIGIGLNVARHFAMSVDYRPGVAFIISNNPTFGSSLTDFGVGFYYRW